MNGAIYTFINWFSQRIKSSILFLTILLTLGFTIGCEKKEPTSSEIIEQADKLILDGNPLEGIQLLETYNTSHPGDISVVESLAFAYADQGDHAIAAIYFSRIAEIDPSQPEYLRFSAEALLAAGDRQGALNEYQRYLAARPQDRAIHLAIAKLYKETNNPSAAIDALLRANRINADGHLQNQIAEHYLNANNLTQAQTWYASAIQYDKESRTQGLLGLLNVALKAQHFADAEKLIKTLDTESPKALDASKLAPVRAELIEWRARKNAAEKALAALKTAPASTAEEPVAAVPSDPKPSTPPESTPSIPGTSTPASEPESASSQSSDPAPAESTTDTIDKSALVDQVETVISSVSTEAPPPPATPKTYEAFLKAARGDFTAGDYPSAIRNFQRALIRNNTDPQVWSELSESQFISGAYAAAPGSASEAVRRAPENPTYLLQYLKSSKEVITEERMISEAKAALRQFPNNPEITLILAQAYETAGNLRNAAALYHIFLDLTGETHPRYLEIQNQLDSLYHR